MYSNKLDTFLKNLDESEDTFKGLCSSDEALEYYHPNDTERYISRFKQASINARRSKELKGNNSNVCRAS